MRALLEISDSWLLNSTEYHVARAIAKQRELVLGRDVQLRLPVTSTEALLLLLVHGASYC